MSPSSPEGDAMYEWARDLFPINRSLTGPGVRETLAYLGRLMPGLSVLEARSGTEAFDWIVPDEWTLRDAYIQNEAGEKVVNFQSTNLHVVGYSTPIDAWMTREELDGHLHSLPSQPDAIPYVTSYYARYWGFSLTHNQRQTLPAGSYRALIDSDLVPGVMNAAELIIPGDTTNEILLSANICHPSLANNELSGMLVLTALARWLQMRPNRRFTYRIVLVPETIGAIWYLSRHAEHMRQKTVAGFVVTCAGDDGVYSHVPSRGGDALADRVVTHVLRHLNAPTRTYTFLDRGSDERQYCSPGIDLPVCSITRSKHGTYPQYHTSLDDLSFISPKGLQGTFDMMRRCLEILEANYSYRMSFPCEPQLGRHGLYPSLSEKHRYSAAQRILDIVAYADGTRDLIGLADAIGMDALSCARMLRELESKGLVTVCQPDR